MKRSLLKNSFAIYLGFSLAVTGYGFTTWQYYFIAIPTIILFVVFYDDKR